MDTPEITEPVVAKRSIFDNVRKLFFTLCVLAILLFALRYVLAPLMAAKTTTVDNAAVESLEKRVSTLESALAELKTAPASAAAPNVDLTAIENRIATLENTSAAKANAAENSAGEPLTPPPHSAQDQAELATLKAEIENLKKADHAYVRSLILSGELHKAVSEGRSFGTELRLLVELRPDLEPSLAPLKEYAPLGLPTFAELGNEFTQSLSKALSPKEKNSSLSDNLRSLVKIRKIGAEQTGSDDHAILARAEAQMKNNNLANAIKEVSTVSDASKPAFAAWLAHANAYVIATDRLNALNTAIAAPIAP